MTLELKNDHSNEIKQFCSFYLDEQLFGIDILDIKEVKDELQITKIFHAPSYINGYQNVRGLIHMIIDLRILLDIPYKEIDMESRLILFKKNVGEDFGILVDYVEDVVDVKTSQMEMIKKDEDNKYEEIQENLPGLCAGVCKLENELMIVLDAYKILDYINI